MRSSPQRVSKFLETPRSQEPRPSARLLGARRPIGMSALAPLATELMRRSETPLCAISRHEQMHNIRLQKPDLLDHVLGAGKQRWRHFKAERLGGFEIDEQLDFCGLLDRQISRLFAAEQPGGVDANPTE